jgi:photosystem II stability/assembly factor-like uncharacterized protein
MKKSYIFSTTILFLLLISSAFSQSGWQQLPTPQADYHLAGIYFKDINTGVASKFKTTNGGQNWLITAPQGGYTMMFPDQNTGYITGTATYKTTNCGTNWIQQNHPAGGLYGIHFPSADIGYACGETGDIIKTTDGGDNWIEVPSPVPNSQYYLEGVYFTDANTGCICGYKTSDYSSVIIKTTNGGNNWVVQNFSGGTGISTLFFINANTGIAIGKRAYKTTDAGATWIDKNVSVISFQNLLCFPSVNIGYSAGMGGVIVKTTDGGETWFRQNSGTTRELKGLYFLNDNTGFACGDYGVVLKTTDGGGPPIGIKPIGSEVPENYFLSQNYPNPFNPSTKIKFSIPYYPFEWGKGDVKLVVYNILGKEISVLVNEQLSPGTYEVEWNGTNYPSGVYFYKLLTDTYSYTKKLVIAK